MFLLHLSSKYGVTLNILLSCYYKKWPYILFTSLIRNSPFVPNLSGAWNIKDSCNNLNGFTFLCFKDCEWIFKTTLPIAFNLESNEILCKVVWIIQRVWEEMAKMLVIEGKAMLETSNVYFRWFKIFGFHSLFILLEARPGSSTESC